MQRRKVFVGLFVVAWLSQLSLITLAAEPSWSVDLQSALDRAAGNRSEIEAALQQVPESEREGMEFLVRYMPQRDLQELSAPYLLENVAYAYRAWNEAPWKDVLPKEIFLNDVLPYACINERRDRWRKDFYDRFKPLTTDASSAGQAAALLNQKIFPLLNVRYSRERRKPDQSPYETIEAGTASCTGLSVLLIDACRAVGVPARFAGIPMWSDRSGNHSWVEVWDQTWHFTGAAEPNGDELDRAWFVDRAAQAQVDQPMHAIYAVSFRPTPLQFPLGWARSVVDVYAVNVTPRYQNQGQMPPAGHVRVMFQALEGPRGRRCAANLRVTDAAGQVVHEGVTKDERFDGNDHLVCVLPQDQTFQVQATFGPRVATAQVATGQEEQTVTLELAATDDGTDTNENTNDNTAGELAPSAVDLLQSFLQLPDDQRGAIAAEPFARTPLTEDEARRASDLLWQDHARRIRATRAQGWQDQRLELNGLVMRLHHQIFGEKPEQGRSLYISMHGGGGAPAAVNDRQWQNQQRLYQLEEGVYVSPRAPTDNWNLWHEAHIDRMFDRLIEDLIVLEDVNPNRVYILGYSAGGDGVYQLAPRMADRLAAAAMMAGHPNEASPLGLRNLPFTIHVGGDDGAYQRNRVAQNWGEQLDALRAADSTGYLHWVKVYEGKGHWLDREDAAAIPWMAQFQRDPRPASIVWRQDDVTGNRFYWLAVDEGQATPQAEVRATRNGQQLQLQTTGVSRLLVRLDDRLVDLDQPVEIQLNGQLAFQGIVPRTIEVLARTLAERGDPDSIFSGEASVGQAP